MSATGKTKAERQIPIEAKIDSSSYEESCPTLSQLDFGSTQECINHSTEILKLPPGKNFSFSDVATLCERHALQHISQSSDHINAEFVVYGNICCEMNSKLCATIQKLYVTGFLQKFKITHKHNADFQSDELSIICIFISQKKNLKCLENETQRGDAVFVARSTKNKADVLSFMRKVHADSSMVPWSTGDSLRQFLMKTSVKIQTFGSVPRFNPEFILVVPQTCKAQVRLLADHNHIKIQQIGCVV